MVISLAACGQSSKIDVESTPKNPMPDSVCYFFPSDKTFNKISSNSFDIPQKGDNLPMCCKYLVAVTKKNIDIDSIMNFVEDNSVQILTDSSLTGMWPQVAEGKIAFSNPKGEIYIINYKK